MTLRRHGLVSLFMMALLTQGCTPTVTVRVCKPTLLEMSPLDSLVITDLEFVGTWQLADHSRTPDSWEGLSLAVLGALLLPNTGPGLPDAREAFPGSVLSDELAVRLRGNGRYAVLRARNAEDAEEQAAVEVPGGGEDVRAVLVGTGAFSVRDVGAWYQGEGAEGEDRRFRIDRGVQVRMNYQLLDATSGRVLTGSGLSLSNDPREDCAEGHDEVAAQENLPHWAPILDRLVDEMLVQMARQLAPYYVVERLPIERGSGPRMKKALRFAKNGLWADAKRIWEKISVDPASKPGDRLSATFDLGIYYEVHDAPENAAVQYTKCLEVSGKKRYMRALERTRVRQRELERLESGP